MSNMEKKLDAVVRCLTAGNEEERARARDALRSLSKESQQPRDREGEICRLLLELGVPDHIKGHRYLVEAIRLAVAEPEILDAVTKELYPRTAGAFHSTAPRAERAIRHAIETAWLRGDMDVMARYFGNTVDVSRGKPTNSEFIARLANMVRRWERAA